MIFRKRVPVSRSVALAGAAGSKAYKSLAAHWREDGVARVINSTALKSWAGAAGLLCFLRNRSDFRVATKNRVSIGPGKGRANGKVKPAPRVPQSLHPGLLDVIPSGFDDTAILWRFAMSALESIRFGSFSAPHRESSHVGQSFTRTIAARPSHRRRRGSGRTCIVTDRFGAGRSWAAGAACDGESGRVRFR